MVIDGARFDLVNWDYESDMEPQGMNPELLDCNFNLPL